jgi:3-oxoadipate enol-lactonase
MLAAHGESIHYLKEGSGPALVLIHSLGSSVHMWKEQIAALKDRYTVIAFDCRGHGQSSANGEVSMTAAAEDLKAVLDHLGVTECHLIGISMGGPIALVFSSKWPRMARSLVLADSFAKPAEGSADRFAATREAIAYISMREFGTQYAAERLMSATPLAVQDELAGAIAKMSPSAYLQTMQSVLLGDFTAALAEVKVPALVLIGENDSVTPRPASDYLVQHIAGAVLEIVPGAGHLSNLDNPAFFNAAISKFLDSQK